MPRHHHAARVARPRGPRSHATSRTAEPRHRRPRSRRAVRTLAAITALSAVAAAGYTIERGDTLTEIAARHGTSVDALVRANDLPDPDRIIAGRTLRTSPEDSAEGSEAEGDADGGEGSASTHAIAPGEHLSGIARLHGTTVSALVAANDLRNPHRILAGHTLTVTGPGSDSGSDTDSDSDSDSDTDSDSDSAATERGSEQQAPRSRAEIGELIERTAAERDLEPALVKALAWQESGWRNEVVSHAGAVGVMQVMPDTGGFVSRSLAGRELDLTDPEDNVLAGVLFLDYLHGLTAGDTERTLAGYYQGLASVGRHGMFDDTRRYIDNVLALRERHR